MRYILIPLIIGWFLGAASGLLFMHHSRSSGMHESRVQRMREHFFRDLKASAEQREKIAALIQVSRKKLETVYAESRPRVEAVRRETRAQIRALLSPEQQAAFDKLDAKREKKFQKRMERMKDRWLH